MKAMGKVLLALISIGFLSSLCDGYVITVDALETDCFYEKVEIAGSKLNLVFETIDGGFLDIDVEVYDPDNQLMHRLQRERHGDVLVTADRPGIYHVCFSNAISTVTPKVVRFDMEVVEPDNDNDDEGIKEAGLLKKMLENLSQSLVQVEKTQKYVYDRDVKHNKINNDTNACITLWVTFHAIAMLIVSTFQVYYLKSYFEISRMV